MDKVHECRYGPKEGHVVRFVTVTQPRQGQSNEHVDAKAKIFVSRNAEQIEEGARCIHGVKAKSDRQYLCNLRKEAIGGNIGQDLWVEFAGRAVAKSA